MARSEKINENVHVKPHKNIAYEYKQRAARRRRTELSASVVTAKHNITELLIKENK